MKNLVFILSLCMPFLFYAQTEGEILYTENVKMEIDLPEDQEHLRSMIPSSQSTKKVLHFTASESLYKDWDASEDDNYVEETSSEGNVQMKMVIMRPENSLYKNLEENRKVKKSKQKILTVFFRSHLLPIHLVSTKYYKILILGLKKD